MFLQKAKVKIDLSSKKKMNFTQVYHRKNCEGSLQSNESKGELNLSLNYRAGARSKQNPELESTANMAYKMNSKSFEV